MTQNVCQPETSLDMLFKRVRKSGWPANDLLTILERCIILGQWVSQERMTLAWINLAIVYTHISPPAIYPNEAILNTVHEI